MNDKKYSIINNEQIRYYLAMLNSKNRNLFFYNALAKCAKDKVVWDVGSGTGLLSYYALKHGAKFLYAVERNQESAHITEEILKKNFDTHRFEVINSEFCHNDIIREKINDSIDVLVSETVGNGLFDQDQLYIWDYIKTITKNKNIICIPDKLSFDLWVWDNIDIDYLPALESGSLSLLINDSCLDHQYAESLEQVDKKFNNYTSTLWFPREYRQKTPQYILTDVVGATYKNNPVCQTFMNEKTFLDYRGNCSPDWPSYDDYVFCFENNLPFSKEDSVDKEIKDIQKKYKKIDINFDFESETSCIVGVMNKIHFEDGVLFLSDSCWGDYPVIPIERPGKFNIKYNNVQKPAKNSHEWAIKKY